MPDTAGALLADCLRALGVRRVFGRPLPGLDHVAVDDPALARLLADAAGRLGPGPGVALLPGGRLRLSSRPGSVVEPVTVDDPARLPGLVASWTVGAVHSCVELLLDLDLDAPAGDDLEPVAFEIDGELYSLSPSLADVRLVTLAGPGVVRDGQVEALQHFAAQVGCGVLNTWGAKGVFRWDSPHHLGTGGLQARDLELAGVLDADVVIAVGIDPDELPLDRWELGQVLEVEPRQLVALAFTWPEPTGSIARPPLYTELATALAPWYDSDRLPLSPARLARDLSTTRPAGALVAADPGPAGLWIARAFPTTEPGSVVVPATRASGFAAAAALVARLDGRDALAVTTAPVEPATDEVLDLAAHLGAAFTVLAWEDDDHRASSGASRRLDAVLGGAWSPAAVEVVALPVDLAATDVLVEVAGPVIAWTDQVDR